MKNMGTVALKSLRWDVTYAYSLPGVKWIYAEMDLWVYIERKKKYRPYGIIGID